jgi:hypothetical protein
LSSFDVLDIEDNKLLKHLAGIKHDHQKVLDIFARRVELYKETAQKTHDPIQRGIIEAKKMVIMSDMGLLATQYQILTDMEKINSRLDSLEKKISPDRKT